MLEIQILEGKTQSRPGGGWSSGQHAREQLPSLPSFGWNSATREMPEKTQNVKARTEPSALGLHAYLRYGRCHGPRRAWGMRGIPGITRIRELGFHAFARSAARSPSLLASLRQPPIAGSVASCNARLRGYRSANSRATATYVKAVFPSVVPAPFCANQYWAAAPSGLHSMLLHATLMFAGCACCANPLGASRSTPPDNARWVMCAHEAGYCALSPISLLPRFRAVEGRVFSASSTLRSTATPPAPPMPDGAASVSMSAPNTSPKLSRSA